MSHVAGHRELLLAPHPQIPSAYLFGLGEVGQVLVRSEVSQFGADWATAFGRTNVIDPRNAPYNCVFDGVTDDSVGFQAAVTAAADANTALYIPTGVARLTVAITATSGLQMFGDGQDVSILRWDDNATKGFTIIGSAANTNRAFSVNGAIGDRSVTLSSVAGLVEGGWAFLDDSGTRSGTLLTKIQDITGSVVTLEDALPCPLTTANTATLYSYTALLDNVWIRDIGFECVNLGATTLKLTLLQLTRCANPLVERCRFDGAAAPLVTISVCLNPTIRECNGRNALTVAGTGVEVQTSTGAALIDNVMTVCQFGLVTSASPWARVEGNRVNGLAVSVALGRGIKLQDASNMSVVSGNTVSNVNLYGVYLQDSAYVTVNGNTVVFSGPTADQHGIQSGGFNAADCHHNLIENNVVANATGYGVSISPTAATAQDLFNVVRGNILVDCADGAVFLGFAARNIIGGNICRGLSTTIGGIIRIAFASKQNVIVDNQISCTGATPPAVYTASGDGLNYVAGNILDVGLSNDLHATDLVGATTADVAAGLLTVKSRLPVISTTIVGTDADTNEKTLWTVPIAANDITVNNAGGFTLDASLSVVADAGLIRVKVAGVQVAINVSASITVSGGLIIRMFGVRQSSTLLVGGISMIFSNAAGGGVLVVTGFSANVDYTTGFSVTITGQNTASVANDIQFNRGMLAFSGVPASAFS